MPEQRFETDASPPTAPESAAIDPAAIQASFDRLSGILGTMMVTVADVSRHRCPYRDRADRCTAQFGCRNKRRPRDGEVLRTCGGDDRLDYRGAWETS